MFGTDHIKTYINIYIYIYIIYIYIYMYIEIHSMYIYTYIYIHIHVFLFGQNLDMIFRRQPLRQTIFARDLVHGHRLFFLPSFGFSSCVKCWRDLCGLRGFTLG